MFSQSLLLSRSNLSPATAVLLAAVLVLGVRAATVVPANGGNTNLSADDAAPDPFTVTLIGPSYEEGASGDAGTGTIILTAPAGTEFDTGGTAPVVRIDRVLGSGPDNRNINNVASGTSVAMTSVTATQLTFTVTDPSSNAVTCALTWLNIRVRPTTGAAGAGDITKDAASTSTMIGVTNGATSFGTLTVTTGVFARLQILAPGETTAPGTVNGKTGTPTDQTAGTAFMVTVNAVDAHFNFVNTPADTVRIGSSDANAMLPADAALANGTQTFNVTLVTAGNRTVTASDVTDNTKTANSSTINVLAGPFADLQLLVPGETADPGSVTGKAGTPSARTAGSSFSITVNAVDMLFNVVSTVTDTIDIASNDPHPSFVPPASAALVNGTRNFTITLRTATTTATITATDQADNTKTDTSPNITVNPGPLANFLVEAAGGGNIPGQAKDQSFNIQVTARDADGNTVTSFTSTVDITSTGTLSQGSGTTASFTAGVLAMHAVTISNTGNFTITATRTGGGPSGTSNSFAVTAVPFITTVVPDGGTMAGGTPVVITGGNFTGATAVTFGGTAAMSFTVDNDTRISAVTAAHAVGIVDVVVTNATGNGTLTNGYSYFDTALAPTLDGAAPITPNTGGTNGGTMITDIKGTNFVNGATVTIGGVAATNVMFVSATQLTVVTPAIPFGNAGSKDVVVKNPDRQSATAPAAFTYVVSNPPSISTLSDTNGAIAGGEPVTINGTNFADGATVRFGGTLATTVMFVSAMRLDVVTPAHAAGAVDVLVANPDTQMATRANGYTYFDPALAPTIATVSPIGGTLAGGTNITVNGTNFATGAALTLDGIAATNVNVLNATTITATTPAHATGPVDVRVTNADTQSFTRVNGFTYFDPAQAPTITNVNPNSGSTLGGTVVAITGTNFDMNATVNFGGTAAAVVAFVSATRLDATTPAHFAGAATVVVANPDTQAATLANGFAFISPPNIVSLSPIKGDLAGGTIVTITGTGFVDGITVDFGGTAATVVTFTSDTEIEATTPMHSVGAVDVTVTNPDGQTDALPGSYTFAIVDFVWSGGGGDGDWGNAANWIGVVVPPDDGTPNIFFSTGNQNPFPALNGNRDVNSINVQTGDNFEIMPGIPANSTLTLHAGTDIGNGIGNINRDTTGIIGFRCSIRGSDGLRVTGSVPQTARNGQRVELFANNTYSGPTTVNNVLLELNASDTIPDASAVTVNSGAILDCRTFNESIGSLSGDGIVSNSLPAGMIVTILIGGNGLDSTFAGGIGVPFGAQGQDMNLIKYGTGTLTLTGTNQYVGSTDVSGGTLLVNGTILTTSGVDVNNGATLGGAAAAPGTATVTDIATPPSPGTGGTVSPGDPAAGGGVGILNASSADLSDGNLLIQIVNYTVAGTDYDRLGLTGALTISPTSQLTLDLAGITTLGTAAGVVTAGSIAGTFDPINIVFVNNPNGLTATVSYTATTVDVTIAAPAANAPGITITPTRGLVTDEAGGTATFTVVLTSAPASNVTINFTSLDTTEGLVSTTGAPAASASLTFTAANFGTPQTVTITGQNDALVDGNVAYTIQTGPVAGDPAYAALNPPDLTVGNSDDDTIIATPAGGLVTDESGTLLPFFDVTLGAPPAAEVTIPVSSTNPAEGQPFPSLLTFAAGNTGPVRVTISGVDDSLSDGDITYGIHLGPAISNDPVFNNATRPDITVTNTDNDSSVMTVASTPQNGAVASGPIAGGTPITITGTNFIMGATLTIGGTPTPITTLNSTTITATTVAHAAGTVDVTVTNPNAAPSTLAGAFIYFDPALAPTVAGIVPATDDTNGGAMVTISGTQFVPGATVRLGGVGGADATNVTVVSSSMITATVPAIPFGNAGFNDVTVTNPDTQSATLPGAFEYTLAPAPMMTSLNPTTASTNGGTTITVVGSNFAPGVTVAVDGVAATNVVFVNASQITFTLPAVPIGNVGPATVVITNPDGQVFTAAAAFTYTPAAAPTVTSVTPPGGLIAGATSITIAGTGFVNGATVVLGGVAATSVVRVNATTITATTGAHAPGVVDVVVTNPDTQSGTLAGGYTYANPVLRPLIFGPVVPAMGPAAGGTSVTITGANFVVGATVTFGGTAATSVVVVSNSSITCVTAMFLTAVNIAVDVVVTNPDTQSATLAGGYTYIASQPPTVTGVTPSNGSILGGTTVTIAGTNFIAGPLLAVSFGGTPATAVTFVSATSITAVTPAHAFGLVNVVVTNGDGQTGTLAGAYTYNPPPTVTAISPVSGPTAGGTAVTITGTGFLAGATVTIGGTAATSVVIVSATSLTALTPAHAAGVADVVVTNADTQSGTLPAAFTFVPPPTVTAISPISGTILGGTAVTITGTGFLNSPTVPATTVVAPTVTIGGTAATSVVFVSATSITAVTPAHAAGAGDVVVTNPDTQTGTLTAGFFFVPPPTVTAISPIFGSTAGGTAVTITGTGFLNSPTVPATTVATPTVTIGGTAATSVVFVSATSLTAVTPAHVFGFFDVVVTNPDPERQFGTLTGSTATGFNYDDPPVITSPPMFSSNFFVAGDTLTITVGASDPEGQPLTFTYDYGDGIIETTSNPTVMHVYAVPGDYTITVTIADAFQSTVFPPFTITVRLATNIWVKKLGVKIGTDGKESYSAQYIYNADRRAANRFKPGSDVFLVKLGKFADINITPPTATLLGTPPKFSFKSAKGVIPAASVKFDESAQVVSAQLKSATTTDTPGSVLPNQVKLGRNEYNLDVAIDGKGKFTPTAGYRKVAFVADKVKVTAKGGGKDSASFPMLLADPTFAAPAAGGTLRFRVLNGATVILDKDFTALGLVVSGSKISANKDAKGPNMLSKFSYDSAKGKMSLSLKGLTLNTLLTGGDAHVDVELTLGAKQYTTGVTIFNKSGTFSTKIP